jgi:pSer/pThr/pTyr-binding forkhead associated (FHA) protein
VSEANDDVTVATTVARPQALTITVGAALYTVNPADAPITIGRTFPAQVQINDGRISRIHARLEVNGGHWLATDLSTNGVYFNGTRQSSVILTDGMTLYLGNAEGIPVTFGLSPVTRNAETASAPTIGDEPFDDDTFDLSEGYGESTEESDVTDPGVARAGAAVAARRRELDIAQRALAKDKVMNAGALIAFEKGRSWPRRSTLARLEQVLNWEQGTIERIRFGGEADPEPGERTTILTNAVQAPLMAQAVDVALSTIRTQIDSLPPQPDAEFSERAGRILADLRKLEVVAANAARSARGAADVAMSLSAVRKLYRELMLRAARAPQPTFGQRLFAARHRAELTTEEAANAAGVSVEAINAAEADQLLSPDDAAAVQALFASLSQR